MSALIADIAMGRIEPRAANAMCMAGGKILKVVEMSHKYGRPTVSDDKELLLTRSQSDGGGNGA